MSLKEEDDIKIKIGNSLSSSISPLKEEIVATQTFCWFPPRKIFFNQI